MMQAAVMFGNCIGPLVWICRRCLGVPRAFRIGAAILLVGGVLVLCLCQEDFQRHAVPQTGAARPGLAVWLASAGFVTAVIVLVSVRLSNSIAGPILPLVVQDILGPLRDVAKDRTTGLVIGIASLSGACGAGLLGHFGDRWGHRRVLIATSALAAAASVLTAGVHTLTALYAVRIVFGFAVAGMMPAANAHSSGRAQPIASARPSVWRADRHFRPGRRPVLGGWLGKTWSIRRPSSPRPSARSAYRHRSGLVRAAAQFR